MLQGAVTLLLNVFKWTILLFSFNFAITGILFVLYNAYYGSFIALGYMVSYQTLNLMFYPFLGLICFIIYDYLFGH